MRRILPALALAAAVVLGGCQNPDGSVNWGNTLLLGAGIGAATALVAGAASDSRPRRHYSSGYGYRGGPRYGYGPDHGYGYGRGYRGW